MNGVFQLSPGPATRANLPSRCTIATSDVCTVKKEPSIAPTISRMTTMPKMRNTLVSGSMKRAPWMRVAKRYVCRGENSIESMLTTIENGLHGFCCGARKAWLHVQVGAAPIAERLQHGNQFFAGAVERVGDLRRDRRGGAANHKTVLFELAQLLGEHFFGDIFQLSADFREAPRPERKVPQDLHLPLAGDQIDRCLDGTPVMIFHFLRLENPLQRARERRTTYKKVRTYAVSRAFIP